jgi:6-phosphogluconolactonase
MATGGKTPRSFCLDPAGRFLLAANQESGDMTMFRINPESGVLESTDQRVAVADSVCVIVVKP